MQDIMDICCHVLPLERGIDLIGTGDLFLADAAIILAGRTRVHLQRLRKVHVFVVSICSIVMINHSKKRIHWSGWIPFSSRRVKISIRLRTRRPESASLYRASGSAERLCLRKADSSSAVLNVR